jgi:hypothetical protein
VPEVARVLAIAMANVKARRDNFAKLTNMGSYLHNIDVQETGKGRLILKRNQAFQDITSFLPCSGCYGFYRDIDLWRHLKRCTFVTDDTLKRKKDRTVTVEARLLLESSILGGESDPYIKLCRKTLLPKMHRDEVSSVVRGDPLIIRFGAVLLRRLGGARANDIKQRMRQLARLTAQAGCSLCELIKPTAFDKFLRAVEQISGHSLTSGRPLYTIPSLALRIGHSVNKCVKVKIGQAIRQGDQVDKNDCEEFAAPALLSLRINKFNKPVLLPVTGDLVKLTNYLTSELAQMIKISDQVPTYDYFRHTLELVLTRLVVFNKRRGGEVMCLKLDIYVTRPNWTNQTSEIRPTLNKVEEELVKR